MIKIELKTGEKVITKQTNKKRATRTNSSNKTINGNLQPHPLTDEYILEALLTVTPKICVKWIILHFIGNYKNNKMNLQCMYLLQTPVGTENRC